MPFYYNLRRPDIPEADRNRTIEGLQRLRAQLRNEIPARTVRDTLLLATWNVRDLGNEDKRFDPGQGPGPRFDESYYYIAEVISAFDLVALQEVNSLSALEKVMHHLGPSWTYMTTDTKRGRGGNQERMTFVYDKRKVRFKNLTGQIVVDPEEEQNEDQPADGQSRADADQTLDAVGPDEEEQFARTPFYAAFQSGWFRFSLCTVHILYGNFKDTTKRVKEIDRIAEFLTDRSNDTGENMILLGDFNILSRKDKTFAPLEKHGWFVPLDYNTNVIKTKAYDQIAFYVDEDQLPDPKGGTFDFFKSVFRDEEGELYYNVAAGLNRPLEPWDNTIFWRDKDKPKDQQRILTRDEFYKTWRTWQMSDHFPLWSELQIDFTDQYLERTKTWKT